MYLFPCKGYCQKQHNGKTYFIRYILVPKQNKKYGKLEIEITWDKNTVTRVIDQIVLCDLDSIHGYQCKNMKIYLHGSLTMCIDKLWRVPPDVTRTISARIKFNIQWMCNPRVLESHMDSAESLDILTSQLMNYLENVTSLSPSRIVDANFEAGIQLFLAILKVAGKTDAIRPQLDESIQKLCVHLVSNFDHEIDNMIMLGNKFTTGVQLFQEKIEDVSTGQHWRDVFLYGKMNEKEKDHKTHKNNTETSNQTPFKASGASETQLKPQLKPQLKQETTVVSYSLGSQGFYNTCGRLNLKKKHQYEEGTHKGHDEDCKILDNTLFAEYIRNVYENMYQKEIQPDLLVSIYVYSHKTNFDKTKVFNHIKQVHA